MQKNRCNRFLSKSNFFSYVCKDKNLHRYPQLNYKYAESLVLISSSLTTHIFSSFQDGKNLVSAIVLREAVYLKVVVSRLFSYECRNQWILVVIFDI